LVAAENTVGVPEIAPVVVLSVSPLGNAGLTEKLLISPPVETMLSVVMATPVVVVTEAEEYENAGGGGVA
jgi:hypothetical protein